MPFYTLFVQKAKFIVAVTACIGAVAFTGAAKAAVIDEINYTVSFPDAKTHYMDVEVDLKGVHQSDVVLKMPVWTPGSYLVREYSKNVELFTADAENKPLVITKTRKNAWRITTAGHNAIRVKYKVYAFEKSVRTSYVDNSRGFLSPAGTFVYPEGMLSHASTVHVVPNSGWAKVCTTLEPVNHTAFTFYSPDYDTLFDSPIEAGNPDMVDFKVGNTQYQIAFWGPGNYDKKRAAADMSKVIARQVAVFGENPNKYYLFFVHNFPEPSGDGLEHLRSSVNEMTRDDYTDADKYEQFLTNLSHEHFHLWNVKRLRPAALGPFDYDNENYTTDLWIAEGFTRYYEGVALHRTRLYSTQNYLDRLADLINSVSNQPGNKIQTLSESSFDAWIKAYRRNENSYNTLVDYYDGGALMALLLDLQIMHHSKGKNNLDDAMRYMYNTYYKAEKRGYTDAEFKAGLEKFTGEPLDDFYNNYINGTADIDIDHYLAYAGYHLVNEAAGNTNVSFGAIIYPDNGKLRVYAIMRNGSAWNSGLSANDEITAIDGTPVTDLSEALKNKKPGDQVTVSILREGLPQQLTITLTPSSRVKYHLEPLPHPTTPQLAVRRKWLD